MISFLWLHDLFSRGIHLNIWFPAFLPQSIFLISKTVPVHCVYQYLMEGLNVWLLYFCFHHSLFHSVMADNQGQMVFLGCMACRDLLGHLVVTDVTELREIGAVRERLGPKDLLAFKETKVRRESLVSRVPQAKKDSEGRKARVEMQGRLSFPRIWTGKNVHGREETTKTREWSK